LVKVKGKFAMLEKISLITFVVIFGVIAFIHFFCPGAILSINLIFAVFTLKWLHIALLLWLIDFLVIAELAVVSHSLRIREEEKERPYKFAMLEKIFLMIFIAILGASVYVGYILPYPYYVGLLLLLIDLGVACFVAVFGSLRIREEEEEKLFK
jgi:cell division protein FtsL